MDESEYFGIVVYIDFRNATGKRKRIHLFITSKE